MEWGLPMHIMQSRRRFLTSLSLASAAGLVGAPQSLRAEPLPETSKVRFELAKGAICIAPMYILGELLRAEGFAELQYVWVPPTALAGFTKAVAHGEAD